MIALTKEQIELNKSFCKKRKVVKREIQKGTKYHLMMNHIIDNHPCTNKEIMQSVGTDYIYSPYCRNKLKKSGKVDYCDKRKVWFVIGWPVGDYPRDTKKDELISYIQRNKVITTSRARELVGAICRTYLNEIKKKGLIINVKKGLWKWVGL